MSLITRTSASIATKIRYNLRSRMAQASFSTDSLTVQHDAEKREFFVLIGKDKAFLNYETIGKDAVNLWHTEVPPVFRGKGVAKILAEAAFDYVVEKDLKMKVTCTYLEKYLRENPQDKYQKQLI